MNEAVQAVPCVRDHLRRATSDIHEALHRAAPFAAITGGTATRADYAATLRFIHRYHSTMAPLCAKAAMTLGAPSLADAHAQRIAALENDLTHFGVATVGIHDAHDIRSADFCIGALYTVQGSTLGGKLIYRQLDSLLPDDNGRTFFKGTAEDGRNWRLLCDRLETCGARLDALDAGAHHAFAAFQSMLD